MAKALDTIWNGGKAEGKAEGLAEGKAKQKDAFARKLLDAHFSDADIISYVEISSQRLKKLKERMGQRLYGDHFSSS